MATIEEVRVEVQLRVVRADDGSTRIWAEGASLTADGIRVRSLRDDITDQLSAARVTGAAALLDDVIARLKTLWGIP